MFNFRDQIHHIGPNPYKKAVAKHDAYKWCDDNCEPCAGLHAAAMERKHNVQ